MKFYRLDTKTELVSGHPVTTALMVEDPHGEWVKRSDHMASVTPIIPVTPNVTPIRPTLSVSPK